MSDMKKDALSELKETVPKLDNSSREMLLSYAAGMIAQKKLEEKKAVSKQSSILSDKSTA